MALAFHPKIRGVAAGEWFKKLLRLTGAQPLAGGLEISDTSIRFCRSSNGGWKLMDVRLPPGILKMGKVQEPSKFVQALKLLHRQITERAYHRVNVVVSLGSLGVYSKAFALPLLEGEGLEKAIALNLQMLSPADAAQLYSGWEVLRRNDETGTLEVLGAFVDAHAVDEISGALFEAGFLAVAVEPKALSIVRLVRTWASGFNPETPYLVVVVDEGGIDFLVLRRGRLYFEYLHPWSEIQGEKGGPLALSVLEETVVRNLNQLLNFYTQQWEGTVQQMVLVAASLGPQIEKIVKDNFQITVNNFQFRAGSAAPPSSFPALGSALRQPSFTRRDKELNLLGREARNEVVRQTVLEVLRFWRVALPVIAGVLLAAFVAADLFLGNIKASLEKTASSFQEDGQLKELQALEASAARFNRLVLMVHSAQEALTQKSSILEDVFRMATAHSVTVRRFQFGGQNEPAALAGEAPSEGDILGFKKALEGDGRFKNLVLPIADIHPAVQGLTFSMQFSVSFATSSNTL
jgi:hypothetical protein